MPVYNAERYLDCSVGSVIAQTFTDWELICFNDASTDGSLAVLERLAASDPRIRIIDSRINVKQGGGRNRAIREARGEYVVFLDADDSLRPESLSRCVDTARRHGADMVMYDYETIPGRMVSPLGRDAAELKGDDLRRRFILHPSPVWSAMYRRSLITDNGLYFPEGVFYEDNAVTLAIHLSAVNPVKVNAPLYGYHIYDTSVSHRMNDYRFFHRLSSARMLKAHLTRLGFYDRWREEIDYVILNQYYTNTITGCVYRFDRVPLRRQRYVRHTVERVVPGFRHNRYYKAWPLAGRLRLELHARFPRIIRRLHMLKRVFHNKC